MTVYYRTIIEVLSKKIESVKKIKEYWGKN
jgi:hypothetical protein